jgi:hypothetical protein
MMRYGTVIGMFQMTYFRYVFGGQSGQVSG